MNEEAYVAAARLVPSTYISQGKDAKNTHQKHIQALMYHRKLPADGWSDLRIKLLLNELALMDSNNFPENVGVGEREGRVYSHLVMERHFNLCHGIGRSGDVAAIQPKAAGSSLINQLTNSLLLDVIKQAGVPSAVSCVLMPVATGMALMMVFLTLRMKRPSARYIIWPRIDQKSCFKSILSAGFQALIVENVLEGDELRTDVDKIQSLIDDKGSDEILCVMTTTSCFAPRGPDKLSDVAKLCTKYNLPHVINNAYGVQSTKCMHLIEEANRAGRVDAFVQSTDKNFLVPVGGAIIAGSNADFIKLISQTYPGRASSTPTIDVFITLLSLGSNGYKKLCAEQKENFQFLFNELQKVAENHDEHVLITPNNKISIGSNNDCYTDGGICTSCSHESHFIAAWNRLD
jgi:O-phospho-L-seryl-tRNASec:L-selenocysteinyl-tRNA synthase